MRWVSGSRSKSWYYDSVYRYTMTDNFQPIPITSAKARRPEGDPKADRRRYYLLTHGSHLVDTARFLGGPIAGVRARLLERFGCLLLVHRGRFRRRLAGASRPPDPGARRFSGGFSGSRRERQRDRAGSSAVVSQVERRRVLSGASDRQFHRILGEDAFTYKLQIEAFAATILDGVPQVGASLDDGLAAVQAMVAIARSVERR